MLNKTYQLSSISFPTYFLQSLAVHILSIFDTTRHDYLTVAEWAYDF